MPLRPSTPDGDSSKSSGSLTALDESARRLAFNGGVKLVTAIVTTNAPLVVISLVDLGFAARSAIRSGVLDGHEELRSPAAMTGPLPSLVNYPYQSSARLQTRRLS